VTIRSDGPYAGSDWQIASIWVRDRDFVSSFQRPVNRWLDGAVIDVPF
jgi:hypothetical protein